MQDVSQRSMGPLSPVCGGWQLVQELLLLASIVAAGSYWAGYRQYVHVLESLFETSHGAGSGGDGCNFLSKNAAASRNAQDCPPKMRQPLAASIRSGVMEAAAFLAPSRVPSCWDTGAFWCLKMRPPPAACSSLGGILVAAAFWLHSQNRNSGDP